MRFKKLQTIQKFTELQKLKSFDKPFFSKKGLWKKALQ